MPHPIRFLLPALCCCLAAAGGAHAQQPEEGPEELVQELVLGEAVYPQARGETQVTLAPSFMRAGGRGRAGLALAVEYGVTGRLQLEAGAARGPDGGEARAGARTTWMRLGGSATHLALGAELALPWGGGDDGPTAEASALLAHDVRALAGTQLMLGAAVERPFRGGGAELTTRIAAVVPAGRWRLLAELAEGPAEEGRSLAAATGVALPLAGGIEFTAGITAALRGPASRGVVLKLTRELSPSDPPRAAGATRSLRQELP